MFSLLRNWLTSIARSRRNPDVSATRLAVAAGRDIRDSTIKIGLDEAGVSERIEQAQQPLSDKLAALAAQIASSKGIDPAPLRAILVKLGEHYVSDAEIPDRLIALADKLIELREELQDRALPDLKPTKDAALALLDRGDLSGAYAELDRARVSVQTRRHVLSKYEAELLADQARILELQISNLAAAEKYGQAAALVSNDRSAFQYFAKQANALQNEGEQFGNNDALRAAIAVWRRAKEFSPFESDPEDHRKAHNNLGSAIYALAERDPTNDNFLEVAALNREVLARDTCESAPKYWGAAQANLASVLLVMGERELDTVKLFESLDRFREALKTVSREERPADWAGVQNNIGNALKLIAQRQNSEQHFMEAIEAYREALSALDEPMPLEKARILMNMGATLSDLGRLRETQPEPFEQALKELTNALSLIQKDRYPVLWATAKHNIGAARNSLGIVTGDLLHYRDSLLVNTEACTVYTRENAPLHWAFCQWGIGIALSKTAAQTRNVEDATAAVNILAEANSIISASNDERAKPGITGALKEATELAEGLQAVVRNKRLS
ncbi:tetratricopeptide repeat protein [Bradyrhizobium sp. SZCCHNRI1073]|uniref:tetratricopeptide repeat protein n=1 Tax=Bradyrhizobium sp. SZCCHNRI1073 TaxID=3057280 RepID=UPI002916A094|nr:tetratricopeptide repeat protein [Bradyrhizobium sp. SZCCHNRI1073]